MSSLVASLWLLNHVEEAEEEKKEQEKEEDTKQRFRCQNRVAIIVLLALPINYLFYGDRFDCE